MIHEFCGMNNLPWRGHKGCCKLKYILVVLLTQKIIVFHKCIGIKNYVSWIFHWLNEWLIDWLIDWKNFESSYQMIELWRVHLMSCRVDNFYFREDFKDNIHRKIAYYYNLLKFILDWFILHLSHTYHM